MHWGMLRPPKDLGWKIFGPEVVCHILKVNNADIANNLLSHCNVILCYIVYLNCIWSEDHSILFTLFNTIQIAHDASSIDGSKQAWLLEYIEAKKPYLLLVISENNFLK